MTHDITEVRYWLDLIVKTAIGVLVSIIGLDYRSVKNSLKELEEHKYQVKAEVTIVRSELGGIRDKIEKIDGKLDKALER